MKVAIIHDRNARDREHLVDNLLKLFPQAHVMDAVKTDLEASPGARAVRGCSLAHLRAAEQLGECLVLEDDAVPSGAPQDFHTWPSSSGIVLWGAETENLTDHTFSNGYRQVLPKFWGSHAVVYTKRLFETPFFHEAYKILASNNADKFCYESLLLRACTLPIFRPTTMPFTTAPVLSSRTNTVQTPRRTL